VRFNPTNIVAYRRKLAHRYLNEAEESYQRNDYRHTVESAQLTAENAAKAIIAIYHIPSWSHDPSTELQGLINDLPNKVRSKAQKLAQISHKLAPEHGRVTYGEPARGITPWELYSKNDAKKALSLAKTCVQLLEQTLKTLKIDL
jgi:HEPN domain-containing protein